MSPAKRVSAGLPLSVGSASLGVRILIAAVFAVTALLCIGGGIVIARAATAGRIVAILLVVPLGLAGMVAAAFVLAPWSRFGVWLDAFVVRLREPRIAVAVTVIAWAIAFLLTWRV